MRSTRMLALAICLCFPLHLSAQIPPGSVTDPDNDALPSPNADPDPDIVSASVTSDGTSLHLSVRYKAGTFDQALTATAFHLDTDQDPSTGNPGTTSNCERDCGKDIIGVEFFVSVLGTVAEVFEFFPGDNLFALVGTPTITFVADGIDAVVPLALLDEDDGLLNFKVTLSEQTGDGFTSLLDTAPDVGLPAAMSAIDGGPPAGAPTITGVFNAATSVLEGEPGHAVAPGSAVAIFGEGFASHLASPSPVPLSSQQIPFDTTLGDFTATVDGIPIPLFGVFRGEDSGAGFDQFNGQLPWEVIATPEKTEATLIITSNGVSSEPREIWVAPASPGIYSWGFGPGPGIVTNFVPQDPARVEFAQRPGTFCASFNLSPALCGIVAPVGSVTDPDNDALPSVNEDPDPDLVSASVTSDGTDLHLSVRFKPGTFDQALAEVQFSLDTDQDPSTGHPGTTAAGCVTGADDIGMEFFVNVGASLGTEAQLFRFLGTCNAFAIAGAGTVTFAADGMDAVVPLALLDQDDGLLNFKVTLSEQIGDGSTSILDTAPDVGLPAATSAIDGVGSPIRPGSVTDPDNDGFGNENEDPDPDLVSASVTSDGTDLHLSVRFKPGTFDQALTIAAFHLDTDQDPSTGHPGLFNDCATDTENIGTEFLLLMEADFGTLPRLSRFTGCRQSSIVDAGTVTIAFVADGIDAVVPLALLDGDDGLLNFKVNSFEQVGGTDDSFTGVGDSMPDVGLPPGMSAIDGGPPDPQGPSIVNEKPAKIGGIITIWANGLGPLTGTAPSGGIPEPGAPLLFAAKTVTVLISGIEAPILGAFLQPQFVALNQINAIVPEGVEPGDAVSIVIEVNCGDGNVFRSREDVTIAIAPADS